MSQLCQECDFLELLFCPTVRRGRGDGGDRGNLRMAQLSSDFWTVRLFKYLIIRSSTKFKHIKSNINIFAKKMSKTSWAGCSPLVGNAPSQKILLWVQQIWKRGWEGREKNFKTNMDFLECCICLLSKRNMNWPGLASPKYLYLGFQTHQEWQVQNYLACLPCQAATIFACRKIQ